MREFRLTGDHILLLRASGAGWNLTETGAACIDPKRPYGNSDVARDIARILGWVVHADGPDDAQRERLMAMHAETETALQILLSHAGAEVEPGLYRQTEMYDRRSWRRVGD